MTARGLTLGYLVISLTMIATPLLIKLGDRIAKRIEKGRTLQEQLPAAEMSNHLVIVGLDEIGFLVALMAQKSGVSFVAFDTDYPAVTRARQAGMNAHVGGILASVVQTAAGLSRARAAFVSTTDAGELRAIALTLRQDYSNLDVYARVRTIGEAQYLRSKGIKHAGTMYLESTLFRGESLLKDMGVPETQVKALIDSLRQDKYKLIVEAYTHAQVDVAKARG